MRRLGRLWNHSGLSFFLKFGMLEGVVAPTLYGSKTRGINAMERRVVVFYTKCLRVNVIHIIIQ